MKTIYKHENGKLYKAEVEETPRTLAGECYFCKQPVYVSEGQLLNYINNKPTHKSCRKLRC